MGESFVGPGMSGSSIAAPNAFNRAVVVAFCGSRLLGSLCNVGNMKSKSWTSSGAAKAKARGTSALASANESRAARKSVLVGTAPWARRGMAKPF